MSIFSAISQAWSWFKSNFVDHVQSAAHVAVTITEVVKAVLANPVVGILENVADAITGTQVPTNVANAINSVIPKILAVELGIVGLPADPTAADILAFEQEVLKAFNVTGNNSKLYTEIAAQVYGLIQTAVNSGVNNFGTWVTVVEQAYADLQKDLAANANPTLPIADQVSASQLAQEQADPNA